MYPIPGWFRIGDQWMGRIVGHAVGYLRQSRITDLTIGSIPYAAATHFGNSIEVSISVNRDGKHALAVALVRQCVEALSVAECGLIAPSEGEPLLRAWFEDQLSLGALRGRLEADAWPRYSKGLWDESWGAFFGQLARAVQPYAHYSPLLMGWQYAVPPDMQPQEGQFIAAIGPKTYDPLKASRITLLHCLLVWTLARIMTANGHPAAIPDGELAALGDELARSEFLSSGKATWAQELWPHMWFTDSRRRFSAPL